MIRTSRFVAARGVAWFVAAASSAGPGALAGKHGHFKVGCATKLVVKPSLGTITVTAHDHHLPYFLSHGLTAAALTTAVRTNVREALPRTGDGPADRWYMFLPVRGLIENLYYCEFTWDRGRDRFDLFEIHGFVKARDFDLIRHYETHARVRASGPPFTISGSALLFAARAGLTLGDVARALHEPLGPAQPVGRDSTKMWQVGLTRTRREVLLEYVDQDGSPHVTKIERASHAARQSFVNLTGERTEASTDRRVILARGPLRYRIIDFGPGVVTKISRIHDVTRAEVIEALELSMGLLPYEDPRRLIDEDRVVTLARLRSGRPMKVALGRTSDVGLVIHSAFEPEPKAILQYQRALMGLTRAY